MKKKLRQFEKASRPQTDVSCNVEKSDDEEERPFLGSSMLSLPAEKGDYLEKCSSESRSQLKRIEQQYKSVNCLYSDISTLVSDQSQDIIMMDDKLRNVIKLHKDSNRHLGEAVKLQNGEWSGSAKWMLFMTIVVIFLILLVIL